MRPSIKPSLAIPIHVRPGTQVLRIERSPACTVDGVMREPTWLVWISASPGWQSGTFIRLYEDGRCERVTLYEDGLEDVFTIKERDHDNERTNRCR